MKYAFLFLIAVVFLFSGCTAATTQTYQGIQEIVGTKEQGKALIAKVCDQGPYQYGVLVGGLGGEDKIPTGIDSKAAKFGERCEKYNPNWESDYQLGLDVAELWTFILFFGQSYIMEGLKVGRGIAGGTFTPIPF
jgi:hypothetical protein